MVAAAKNPGTLQRKDIGCRLHNTEFPSFSGRVTAEGTLLLLRKESAQAAGMEGFACPSDGTGQLVWLGIGRS